MKRAQSVGIVAALTLAGRTRALSQESSTIRVAGPATDGFKVIYYGVRSGLFAKHGLNVEITLVSNGTAAAAALTSGDIDVAMFNIVTLIRANRHGLAMRMLAANALVVSDKPIVSTVVLKDSPIRQARDLNGKTVACPGLGDVISVGTQAWIDQRGGDSKTVKLIEIGNISPLAILEQGRADAASLNEPFASQVVATGKVRVLGTPLEAIAKRFAGGAFAVMEPFVEKNFETMRRLAQAIHEAALYTNSHLPETVALVASYSGVEPEAVAKMNRAIDPEYSDVRIIQPVIDALAKYGVIDKTFPAEELISSAALKAPQR